VSPRRRRLALYSRFHRDKNIGSIEVVEFLRQLLRHLRGPVALLWDRSSSHRGVLVGDFLLMHPRLRVEQFPGYAPELNPDEFVWNHLKRAVANGAPYDLTDLKHLLHPSLMRLRQSQSLLWSCIAASDLPWS
jgi:transposase